MNIFWESCPFIFDAWHSYSPIWPHFNRLINKSPFSKICKKQKNIRKLKFLSFVRSLSIVFQFERKSTDLVCQWDCTLKFSFSSGISCPSVSSHVTTGDGTPSARQYNWTALFMTSKRRLVQRKILAAVSVMKSIHNRTVLPKQYFKLITIRSDWVCTHFRRIFSPNSSCEKMLLLGYPKIVLPGVL